MSAASLGRLELGVDLRFECRVVVDYFIVHRCAMRLCNRWLTLVMGFDIEVVVEVVDCFVRLAPECLRRFRCDLHRDRRTRTRRCNARQNCGRVGPLRRENTVLEVVGIDRVLRRLMLRERVLPFLLVSVERRRRGHFGEGISDVRE